MLSNMPSKTNPEIIERTIPPYVFMVLHVISYAQGQFHIYFLRNCKETGSKHGLLKSTAFCVGSCFCVEIWNGVHSALVTINEELL
jgi:hypothetical protein